MVEDCVQERDRELQIGGCTAVICSGQYSGRNLGTAYNNRGIAYADLGEYHRAIEDYNQALRLDPAFASAYVNRGFAYLITRPAALTGAEHPEYPTRMDDLLRALGADPVDWSYKTECCGGALGVSQTPIALEMSRKVLENARECGAEAVVTMCPMCHMNLDARQPQIGLDPAMPVLHATQLAALAFGLEAKAAALEKNVIDPRPLLAAKVP
jgi:tetratricopeptide (TPR) repeat protein